MQWRSVMYLLSPTNYKRKFWNNQVQFALKQSACISRIWRTIFLFLVAFASSVFQEVASTDSLIGIKISKWILVDSKRHTEFYSRIYSRISVPYGMVTHWVYLSKCLVMLKQHYPIQTPMMGWSKDALLNFWNPNFVIAW